jgi:chemotaxis protein histidine kinase CheA
MGALDPDTIAELRADLPPAALAAILATFEADLGRLQGELQRALAAADLVAFGRAAHTLSGAAGAVGARDVRETARACLAAENVAEGALLLPLLRVKGRAALAALRAALEAG